MVNQGCMSLSTYYLKNGRHLARLHRRRRRCRCVVRMRPRAIPLAMITMIHDHGLPYKVLSRLNPAKATGPDGLPNWLQREFASLVAFPVKTILNASFSEQRLPSSWKYADVTPLPKKMPVQNLKKDLRPIPLTPCLSKVAEDFVVTDHLKPTVMKVLDSNQYGAVPKSSTTIALLSMIHG